MPPRARSAEHGLTGDAEDLKRRRRKLSREAEAVFDILDGDPMFLDEAPDRLD